MKRTGEKPSEVCQNEVIQPYYFIKDKDLRQFVQSNTYQQLSPAGVKLYLLLLSYGSPDKAYVYPSQQQLKEQMGGIGYKKLISAIKELEDYGLISYSQGSGRLNSVFTFKDSYDKIRFYPSKQQKKLLAFPEKKENTEPNKKVNVTMPKSKPYNNNNTIKQNSKVNINKTQIRQPETTYQNPGPNRPDVVVSFEKSIVEKDFVEWTFKECKLSKVVTTELLKKCNIGEDAMEIIKREWLKQKNNVKNPSGWIRRFLDGSIDLSPLVSASKEKQKKGDEMKRLNESLAERHKEDNTKRKEEIEKKIEDFKSDNPALFQDVWDRAMSICRLKGYSEDDELWEGMFMFNLMRLMNSYQAV